MVKNLSTNFNSFMRKIYSETDVLALTDNLHVRYNKFKQQTGRLALPECDYTDTFNFINNKEQTLMARKHNRAGQVAEDPSRNSCWYVTVQ